MTFEDFKLVKEKEYQWSGPSGLIITLKVCMGGFCVGVYRNTSSYGLVSLESEKCTSIRDLYLGTFEQVKSSVSFSYPAIGEALKIAESFKKKYC